ncbi:MAG TPA: metalloregulator ArsR/SmtB family transcription factor [Polyangia bacterium]|nr:metalloregulator ArsR/SmtB family transcription factor [Polyangia bacterium]
MVERARRRRQFFRPPQFGGASSRPHIERVMVAGEVRELDDRALVRALRALGDPTRFRMVQEVAASAELCCGQIAERFDVTQPTISHHLKVLFLAGVLSVRNQGKHRYISVNEPMLSTLVRLLPARLMPEQRPPALRPPDRPPAASGAQG